MGRASLADFSYFPEGARIVQSHRIPTGEFSKVLLHDVRKIIDAPIEGGGFGGNSHFGVYEVNGGLAGANVFLSALIHRLLMPYGAGAATLADLNKPEVLAQFKGKHYSVANAVVLNSTNKGIRDTALFNSLAEFVPHLNQPLMISGLTVEPWPEDREGYGLKLVPAAEFKIIYDDRFSFKYDRMKFNNTDENGLPIFDAKGERRWHVSNKRLSGLVLDRGLGLLSNWDGLGDSDSDGRVVPFVRGAGAQNLDEILST